MSAPSEDELLAAVQGPTRASAPPDAYTFFRSFTGSDLLLIFGDTGSGKTKVVSTLARQAAQREKRVIYRDLERNLPGPVLDNFHELGIDYRQDRKIRDVRDTIHKDHADLMVIDSATLQITGRWLGAGMDGRGKLLQEVQGLYQRLKDWCDDNHSMAILVAQPISEFGEKKLAPMGDKASFFTKEELYLRYERHGMQVTNRQLEVYKSRSLAEGTLVCEVKTDAMGAEFASFSPEFREATGDPR